MIRRVTSPADESAIVDRLNTEIRRALDLPGVEQRLVDGSTIATLTAPEGMGQQLDDDVLRWRRIVHTSNIRVE